MSVSSGLDTSFYDFVDLVGYHYCYFVGFQVNKNALWLKCEVIQEVRDQTRIFNLVCQ